MKKLILFIIITLLLLCSAQSWTQEPPQSNALRILVAYDATGSMSDATVNPPTTAELRALAKAVAKKGGDMAYVLITDKPEAFTRYHVEPPPTPPVLTAAVSHNPFIKAKEQAANKPKMDEYQRKVAARQADATARMEAFLRSIAALHVQPRARASNINALLDRASIFFAEPDDQPTDKWLLLVSDGADTTGRPMTATFAQSLRTIVVHRSAAIGIFSTLNPRPAIFESVASAVQKILKGEN